MEASLSEKKHSPVIAPGISSSKQPPGMRDFPLYTSKSRGALYVPEKMSQKDFELLKNQITNSLLVIAATAVSEEQ